MFRGSCAIRIYMYAFKSADGEIIFFKVKQNDIYNMKHKIKQRPLFSLKK